VNEAEDSVEGRHVGFEKRSNDVEVNGFGTPGAGQDEKDEDDRLEFIVERNKDPN
jgi:hypothetical protein